MKRVLLTVVLAVLYATVFSSCGDSDVYSEYRTVPSYKWERIGKGKVIAFDKINISNTDDVYDVSVMVRHTPYINEDAVKFLMRIVSPSGITRESIHTIKLKDRTGEKWLGDALGDIIDLEETCKTFMTFPEKGDYTIELVNLSTKYELVGIMELGIRIVKSDLDYKTKE